MIVASPQVLGQNLRGDLLVQVGQVAPVEVIVTHHGHQVPHLFNTTVNIPPMEDDVAPDAVVEEGSDHVKEDVEDSGAFKMFNPVL